MKLFFVYVGEWGRARAGTLSSLGLGAETRGILLTEAAGIAKREKEEGGGELGGSEVLPSLIVIRLLLFAKGTSCQLYGSIPESDGQELFPFSGLID